MMTNNGGMSLPLENIGMRGKYISQLFLAVVLENNQGGVEISR
jgi:hypothetical protein